MSIASVSIKRPIFITSIVLVIIFTGAFSLLKLGVDLFPDVNFPFVVVSTVYTGAGPEEVENLISRPLEEELSSLQGVKRITSRSQEGFAVVFVEFTLSTDIKYGEQQVRNRVSRVRRLLPSSIEEPIIVRFDPADQPVVRYALFADLPPARLYELAKEKIKPRLEQAPDVGSIALIGGVKREIQIEIDRNKLNALQLSAVGIGQSMKNYGLNVPVGKHEQGASETTFRTIGQFDSLKQIEEVGISFGGEVGNAVSLRSVATVRDGTEDAKNICELWAPTTTQPEYGFFSRNRHAQIERQNNAALFIDIYKQSGSNTVTVTDGVKLRVEKLNEFLKDQEGHPRLVMVRDGSRWIRANVEDVGLAIVLGILLTVLVVYLFLGNIRSTIITGLALPNSLLGAFILMYIMGFTINVMTLLALSLAIGLLVDDAIVVRENIFRKMELGESPVKAAEDGTTEVALAVIATTATVLAVFLPIGFLSGIVGQFFKQFGLTVCFAMIISLFDAMTIAPMLSAYFGGQVHGEPNFVVRGFRRFQDFLEKGYIAIMRFGLKRPIVIILLTVLVFVGSILTLGGVKKTFLPPNDQGEFMVSIQLPPGTALQGTYDAALKIREKLQKIPEMNLIAMVVGSTEGEPNVAIFGVGLTDFTQRTRSTQKVQEEIREMLKPYAEWKPSVNEYSAVGGGVQYPFNVNIMGDDLQQLQPYAEQVVTMLKGIPDLTDVSMDYRAGKPEYRIEFDPNRMQNVGVNPTVAGAELRYHIAGEVVGTLRERGYEYDIRMRLRPEQRNLKSAYAQTRVPNNQFKMIPLAAIATGRPALGPEKITRQDRSRVIQIHANLAPGGAIGSATDIAKKALTTKLIPPKGTSYVFWGQSEDFIELLVNVGIAFLFAIVFIYLVLASLYESFITPLAILISIPPAISGAFLSLYIFNEMLNIFSMIGLILLMGLVTKNSILLVDYALEGIRGGLDINEAILRAGRTRLRPILMTSLAMIAGTMPIALGLGEASRARTAMGIAIIGGIVVSTVLTLIVVPAIFGYIERFREWIEAKFRPAEIEAIRLQELSSMSQAMREPEKKRK
ncbi:MAG TPA: efflux RND transporter permease subunit [Leptospiraceae bacterium]|nr:efflux RND transporter permease subunit [Leptospirales bacterium]HMU82718.1 efflux RND transporter permease subunit [Leptospiraceae bacterium]HMX56616.1 efflux RND transporter permease subunit [Leptospiraceae bacterium]HNE23169.1 efflux RND transporter permease subunit [Leptospiraceae bacterium]HNL01367.1 efflux RND transporter permease subunit [Leptospiraceae bacterium]